MAGGARVSERESLNFTAIWLVLGALLLAVFGLAFAIDWMIGALL